MEQIGTEIFNPASTLGKEFEQVDKNQFSPCMVPENNRIVIYDDKIIHMKQILKKDNLKSKFMK